MKKDIKANNNLVRSVYLILVFAIVGVTVTEGSLRYDKCNQEIVFQSCKNCNQECKNWGGVVKFFDWGKCEGSWWTGRHCMCHVNGNYCRPECLHEIYVRNCDYCYESCKKQENGALYDGGYCEGHWPYRQCMCHKIGADCE